jgi:hypothetical protein
LEEIVKDNLTETMQRIENEVRSMSDHELCGMIMAYLDVFEESIAQVYDVGPGIVAQFKAMDMFSDLMVTSVLAMMYVRELTDRPAPEFIKVQLGSN